MECFVCKKEYNKLCEALIEGEFRKICYFCINRECSCGSFFFKEIGSDIFCESCGKKFEEFQKEKLPTNPT